MPVNISEKDGINYFNFDFTEGIVAKSSVCLVHHSHDDFVHLIGYWNLSSDTRKAIKKADGSFDSYEDFPIEDKIVVGKIKKKEYEVFGKKYPLSQWDELLVERLKDHDGDFVNIRIKLGKLFELDYDEDKAIGNTDWEKRYISIEPANTSDFAKTEFAAIKDKIPKGFTKKFKSESDKLKDRLDFLTNNSDMVLKCVDEYATLIKFSPGLEPHIGKADRLRDFTVPEIIGLLNAVMGSL